MVILPIKPRRRIDKFDLILLPLIVKDMVALLDLGSEFKSDVVTGKEVFHLVGFMGDTHCLLVVCFIEHDQAGDRLSSTGIFFTHFSIGKGDFLLLPDGNSSIEI